ncbi:hypothetical protein [Streptomyces sp. NPDC089919]|uniref:hypothetical protein n=1 Tax=Streptomyces sp. NPDC089919 TaxID=3155188 RepID=UPI00343474E7
MTVPSVDWRAVAFTGPGRRSPLAGLTPVGEPRTLFLAGVARIVGVGRAAVVSWRRRHAGFPPAVGGTDVSPRFETAAVVAWLLAHDKIAVLAAEPTGTLVRAAGARGTRRFRLDEPRLETAEAAGGEDRVSAWFADADAEAVTTFTARATGAAVHSLTVPGRAPLAVPGGAGPDRRPVHHRLRLAVPDPGRPAGRRGAAVGSGGGVVRHGVPDAAPGPECRCRARVWRGGAGVLVPGARDRGVAGDGVAPGRRPPPPPPPHRRAKALRESRRYPRTGPFVLGGVPPAVRSAGEGAS